MWGKYRHAWAVGAGVAMEKMALVCWGVHHARERAITGGFGVVCWMVAQTSTVRRAGEGGEGGR